MSGAVVESAFGSSRRATLQLSKGPTRNNFNPLDMTTASSALNMSTLTTSTKTTTLVKRSSLSKGNVSLILKKRSSSKEQAQQYLKAKYVTTASHSSLRMGLSASKGQASQLSLRSAAQNQNSSVLLKRVAAAPRGVKHVVANLDCSTSVILDKTQPSSCDVSFLNMTSPLKTSGLKEPTSFEGRSARRSSRAHPDEIKPKYSAVARHVQLTLDRRVSPDQIQAQKKLQVPVFSREAMQ